MARSHPAIFRLSPSKDKWLKQMVLHQKTNKLIVFLLFKGYDSKKTLELLKSCRDKFVIKTVEGEKFIEAKPSLKLCDRFLFPSTQGRCDQHPCNKLHICRRFLEKSCDFGESCKKPHTFDNCVTKNLLIQHNLDTLSSSNLEKLFKKALKEHKVRYAAKNSGPMVCGFYRKRRSTCKGGDKCKFLHVCEEYIKGNCKSEVECGLCHSFETKHARRVLATHNLGDFRNEKEILSKLRSNLEPQPQTLYEKPQTSLDMKLFSHLIAHGENCRLPIADVEIRLQEISGDEVSINIYSFMDGC